MIIYHLGFHCGHYDDHQDWYLGCYSSDKERDLALQRYREESQTNPFPMFIEGDYRDGNFYTWHTQLDADVYDTDIGGIRINLS